jgi:hypothetical protein
MTQSAWKTGGAGAFPFFQYADEAIVAFFANTTSGFANHKAIIATATSRSHQVYELPMTDESESNFPLIYVWSGGSGFSTTEYESGGYAVRVSTRILVWTVNADPQQAAEDCIELCVAVASLLQQTHDETDSDDWAQFYANWAPIEITCDPIEFLEDGEGRGLCQGRLNVTWTHNE